MVLGLSRDQLTRATLAAGLAAKVGKNLGASEFGSGSSLTKRAREDDARAGDENADWRAGVLGCVHQSDMAGCGLLLLMSFCSNQLQLAWASTVTIGDTRTWSTRHWETAVT